MRRWTVRIVVALVLVLLVAQAIPVARTNPPVDPAKTMAAHTSMPGDVSAVLQRACQDCHSNQTTWPWYSQVAPISWLLVRHVSEGRRELNMSEWAQYQPRRKERKLKEMCEQVQKGKMPMASYLILHPDAQLSEQERGRICEWAGAIRNQLTTGGARAAGGHSA